MIAVALAGGGERAIAWELGVLAGLADCGVDLREAVAVVGTSAGALVAARLAAGVDPRVDADRIAARNGADRIARAQRRATLDGAAAFDALARAWESGGTSTHERRRALGRIALERSPGGEEAHVAAVAGRLESGGWPPALRVVAVDAERGERMVFDAAAAVALERAVAASRAVPVLLPPITVGGRRCIDGALGSATNADVLAAVAASRVFVIAPFSADPPPTGPERLWLLALRDEVVALEAAGRRVTVVHASDADLAAMGPDPLSSATAPLAVDAGRTRGRALADQIRPSRAA
jgi:NTE family protein